MSFSNRREQKSPPRRFLLILGIALLVSITIFGLMILLWDKLALTLGLTKYNRIAFGSLFIVYGILRSSRLFVRKKDDE